MSRLLNPDLVTLEEVKESRCIVLLGESGIGKTTTIEEYVRRTDSGAETLAVVLIELRSVLSAADLRDQVNDRVDIDAWRNDAERELLLFLDGLDECQVHFPLIATALVDQLRRLPHDRLRLRVSCRTADWPRFLERQLRNIYNRDTFRILELAPLSFSDVETAARARGVNVDQFVRQIVEMGVGPLAAKPLTLEFLLNLFGSGGALPTGQTELYHDGLRLLVEELSESRRASRAVGHYGPDERLRIAARIAGVLVFGGRDAVWTAPDRGDVPAGDVTINDLLGVERTIGHEIQVSEDAVRETLSTGLFTARGSERMGFAHHSYAEFLAARYIRQHQLTPPQALGLLLHPDGGVVPQLRGTTAWAAIQDDALFSAILAVDPDLLLRVDVSRLSVNQRQRLTAGLLRSHSRGEQPRRGMFDFPNYHGLVHPDLAEQLRPWVTGEVGNEQSRRVAIEIGGICGTEGLSDLFADIALDSSDPIDVRVEAVLAIARLPDSPVRDRLRLLALDEVRNDDDDRIKGLALQTLWPHRLKLEEVLASLRQPRRGSEYHGPYQAFLTGDLPDSITVADLPLALRWAADHLQNGVHPGLGDAADQILSRAWRHVDDAAVLEALARATWIRLETQYEPLDRPFSEPSPLNDSDRRRTVLAAIMALPPGGKPRAPYLALFDQRLARLEDVPWMVQHINSVQSQAERMDWAELIRMCFNFNEVGHVDAVVLGSETIRELRDEFAPCLGHTDTASPAGRKLKADYLRGERRRQRIERANRPREASYQTTAPMIQAAVDASEVGDARAFPQLVHLLAHNADGSPGKLQASENISEMPGWGALDQVTSSRIVEAAKRHIVSVEPKTETWLATWRQYWPAECGYRAFLLLEHEDEAWLQAVDEDVWLKWTPAIVGIAILHGRGTEEERHTILARAHMQAAKLFGDSFAHCVRLGMERHGFTTEVERYHYLIDDAIAPRLITMAHDSSLGGTAWESLVAPLVHIGRAEAIQLARSCLRAPLPAEERERQRAVAAARMLLMYRTAEEWLLLWKVIRNDAEFGKHLLRAWAEMPNFSKAIQLIEPELLADLSIWLLEHARQSTNSGGMRGNPGPNRLDFVLSTALNALVNRATADSINALERVALQFPGDSWLRDRLHEGHIFFRERSWTSPRIQDILVLDGGRNNRLVRNANELLAVVLESLARIQNDLRNRQSSVRLLWDTRGEPQPKDEADLSDFLADRIERDIVSRGVIINREVEVRRGSTGVGSRTDIHVDAISQQPDGGYDRVTVVVEVKGCWHRELKTAMESQLVSGYLAESAAAAGIYAVGWFFCDDWDRKDRRRTMAVRLGWSLDDAKQYFEDQAKQLSTGRINVRSVVLDLQL